MFHGIFFPPRPDPRPHGADYGEKIIMPEVSGRIRKVQNRFETYLKTKNDRITSPEELTLLFTNESIISLMRDFAVKDPMQP